MKAALLFVLFAVGFTAAVAAPHVSNEVAVGHGQKNLLIDIISAIIGVDIKAVIAQTQVTIQGLERVFQETGKEIEDILVSSGQETVAEFKAIIEDSAAKAEVIIEPIATIVERILSLLGIGQVQSIGDKDLIVDLIVALIKRLVKMVETAITDLQELSIDTIIALQNLAVTSVADPLNDITSVLAKGLILSCYEIIPLLDLLEPLLFPSGPPDVSEIINRLIKAILGLDIDAVVAQVDVTITGLDALFTASATELNEILVSGGINAEAQLQAVIVKANAEAEAILKPLINLINLIISIINAQGTTAVQRDLIGSIIEQLFQYIANSAEKLQLLVVDTVNELVQVAIEAGANTAGQIEELAQQTITEAQAIIKPLLDLLDPIIPDAATQVAHLSKKRLH